MKKINLLFLGGLSAVCLSAAPIRTLANLTSIQFFEGSGGVTTHTFAPGDAEITAQLAGQLNSGNNDFVGLPNEFYDVYYSNSDGTFNVDGEYISIEATYLGSSSSGLNIMEVLLNFAGASPFSPNHASTVTSFLAGSIGYIAASELLAVDGSTATGSAMGRQTDPNERMRITVGFTPAVASVPEPGSVAMAAIGLAALAGLARRRR